MAASPEEGPGHRPNRIRALEAAGLLRYGWPSRRDSGDGVEEAANALWRAREEACWEAVSVRLAAEIAALEAAHEAARARLGERQRKRRARLKGALEAGRPGIRTRLRRMLWWLRLRAFGGGSWRAAKDALAGNPPPARHWRAALERRHGLQDAAAARRHERRLGRAASRAARAYRAAMGRQASRCRRDAVARLASREDRAAGVTARAAATDPELAGR